MTSDSLPAIVLPPQSTLLYQKLAPYSELRQEGVQHSARENILQRRGTVFGLTWDSNDKGNFLLACTSSGELVVWEVASEMASAEGLETHSEVFEPLFRRTISRGKLYSIKMFDVSRKDYLFASGDDGILVFDWGADILKKFHKPTKKMVAELTPIKMFKPHSSPVEDKGIEINDMELLETKNGSIYIFGAAGDSFGCYQWNFETGELVKTYSSAGRGYLHSIQVIPSDENNQNDVLLLGGEDGILTIWDLSDDKRIDCIDMTNFTSADIASAPMRASPAPSSASSRGNNRKRSRDLPSRWISSICANDHSWWTVAGGNSGSVAVGGSSRSGAGSGKGSQGFLATFHAPTRSVIAFTETRETPQHLAILPTSVQASIVSQDNLVSVANEGVISHWDRLSLERTRRSWCSPPSAYAVATSKDGFYMAIGGVGCFVDLFDQNGEKILCLNL